VWPVKVLVVDRDENQLDLTTYALRLAGYTVVTATDGAKALQRWELENPDVVVLDADLPLIDGFEVCRRIRESAETPILMLTANKRDDDDARVRSFQLGADACLLKPASSKQLTAYIQAVLRRAGTDGVRQQVNALRVGDLVLDRDSQQAIKDGEAIQLTPIEFRILYLLAMNPNRIIPHARLVEYAWAYDGGDIKLVKTHIAHIRAKLTMPVDHQTGIEAIPGVGYRLIAPA
jgi:DNA-binding response OmpR family regulator